MDKQVRNVVRWPRAILRTVMVAAFVVASGASGPTFGFTTGVLPPRVARFGATYSF